MRVVAVTGGRRDEHGSVLIPSRVQLVKFWELIVLLGVEEVVHGNAIGTDRTIDSFIGLRAEGWDIIEPKVVGSILRWLEAVDTARVVMTPYPVDIRIDGPWPLAGHKRNRRMLVRSKAEGLVAFPGGNGTANCIDTALEMRLRVWKWDGGREQGEFKEIT